jgi:hypothetical protein
VLLLVAEAGAPESSSSAYSPMYKRPCYSWPCSPCGASDALHTRELEVHQTSSMSERTGWTESSTMRSAAPTGRLRPHSRRRRGKLALLVMMGVLGRAEARVRADVFTEGLPPIYDADAPNHVRPLAHQHCLGLRGSIGPELGTERPATHWAAARLHTHARPAVQWSGPGLCRWLLWGGPADKGEARSPLTEAGAAHRLGGVRYMATHRCAAVCQQLCKQTQQGPRAPNACGPQGCVPKLAPGNAGRVAHHIAWGVSTRCYVRGGHRASRCGPAVGRWSFGDGGQYSR